MNVQVVYDTRFNEINRRISIAKTLLSVFPCQQDGQMDSATLQRIFDLCMVDLAACPSAFSRHRAIYVIFIYSIKEHGKAIQLSLMNFAFLNFFFS